MTGTTTGVADVFIDGDYVATVNLVGGERQVPGERVFDRVALPWGVHEVWIQPVRTTNTAGKYIDFDAVDVVGTTSIRLRPSPVLIRRWAPRAEATVW